MPDSADDLPALLGGPPVFAGGPPPWPPPDPDLHAALAAAVAAGAWGQYLGDHVPALEADLAAFHGVPHALTCASGTLAVEAALRALRVGPGDEVVMAAYEYESNFLTVHAIGAKPVLVDVVPHNWNLDPARLEDAFSPQTKAVLCSHLHGGIVPMREVTEIARKHGVGVVEDAAQAPGATVQGKPAGTWGDVGTLSFGGSKLLAAGRGGALLFRDAQAFQRAKVWLHRGVQPWAPLSELQAAALRPQLAKLREATELRAGNVRELVRCLSSTLSPGGEGGRRPGEGERAGDAPSPAALRAATSPPGERSSEQLSPFGEIPGFAPFENTAADSGPAFYKVGFRYDPAAFGLPRELFVKALRAEGVAFDAGFNAVHVNRSPSRFRAADDLAHATAAHHGCVVLHHPVLSGTAADARRVADAVVKVYRNRELIERSAVRRG